MSAVNNAFTSAFPTLPGTTPEFGSAPAGSESPPPAASRDSIGIFVQPSFAEPSGNDGSAGWTGWSNGSDGGLAGFNSILNGFISALQNVLAGIGQQFGLTGGSGGSAGSQPGSAQTYFSNATAGSVGDPHDTFDASSNSGDVKQTWNSMASHNDLLDSDSFQGGYRVATTVTTPKADGTTMNAQAQVVLDGGQTKVSMNANGSYSVVSGGQDVALQAGQAVSLGDGATVTLQPDASLTVSDENAAGASLVTNLRAGGGGVNVESTGSNVDLGGYLVSRSDAAGRRAPQPEYPVPQQSPISYASDALQTSEDDAPIVMV